MQRERSFSYQDAMIAVGGRGHEREHRENTRSGAAAGRELLVKWHINGAKVTTMQRVIPGSGNDHFGSMKVNKQLATSTTAVLYTTAVQGLADARKRAHRSGLVQFFAVYQFDRGGILQMCHTVDSWRTVQPCSARICGVESNS